MTGGVAVVETRSPAGTIAQASFINANTTVDAIADTGDVVYDTGPGGSRYLGRAGDGAPAVFADNVNGVVSYVAGVGYERLGQELFQYTPTDGGARGVDGGVEATAPDGAMPDGGGVAEGGGGPADEGSTPDASIQGHGGGRAAGRRRRRCEPTRRRGGGRRGLRRRHVRVVPRQRREWSKLGAGRGDDPALRRQQRRRRVLRVAERNDPWRRCWCRTVRRVRPTRARRFAPTLVEAALTRARGQSA